MDLKYLLTAGAFALAFVACDNTTSATTDGDEMIGQKGATTENTGSSPKSSSSKGKISSSSTAKSSSSNEVFPDEDEYDDILRIGDDNTVYATECSGDISQDHWHAYVKETRNDLESVGTIDVTIEGTTMTTIIEGSADMGSEAMCSLLKSFSELGSEEPSENDKAFGPAIEENLDCDGSIVNVKEKRIKTNITENDRKLAYEESIIKCKSY